MSSASSPPSKAGGAQEDAPEAALTALEAEGERRDAVITFEKRRARVATLRAQAAETELAALRGEVERIKSDREYIIGFNHGWEEAVAQTLTFPAMLRKMWSGGEVQAWIDKAMSEARAALATAKEG